MTKPAPARPALTDVVAAEDVDTLVTAMLTASRVLVAVSAHSLAEVEDRVTVTQFRTLVVLDGQGPMNLNRLAEILAVTPSTALRMIDRLLAADLVTRQENAANRREVVLGLTAAGRQLVHKVTATRRAEISRIVTKVPVSQRAALVRALRAFAEAAGEPPPDQDAAGRLGW